MKTLHYKFIKTDIPAPKFFIDLLQPLSPISDEEVEALRVAFNVQ